MSRCRRQFQRCSAGCKVRLLAAALTLALSACDEGPGNPGPPQSPPRPVTAFGHVFTAQLDLPARPVAPPPGEM